MTRLKNTILYARLVFDKNINDPDAHEKFQTMASAYEILNDPQMREVYDAHGMEGVSKGPGGPDFMDPNDMFAQFFGGNPMFGFSFGPGRKRTKGEDSVIPYEVSLEDLYNGKTIKMNMEKDVICSGCKGSGARGNAKPKTCSTCDGKGWTTINPGPRQVSRVQCRDCKGVGERLKEKERCKKCKGECVVKEKTRQEIHIEKGMADKQRIVLAGAGDQQPDIPAGDVIFVLKAQKHESFQRIGNDLLTQVKITLSEALLGFSRILVTHLDGRGIRVSSPPGKIINPNDAIILRGEGMPIFKRPDDKGDLHVVLTVEMPDADWLNTVDIKALSTLLPPKKEDIEPLPEIVDEANYEESDIGELHSTFLDQELEAQFEDDWEDEDSDDDIHGQPECQPQ
ncbi:chaperone regulator [Coprinopsis cinerea okayama7|uniref:Chaperone regulator n=1 Tax=Coprinopsis cinerea (strain Okayama-7 / 130 / ATCC MYA-4618 / FGSC 9003) TaxID=240176 RepID=A8NU01_COPC7|nr:chaperone regulator [Coprinopsis cinerea okayama7\|eukprot:XP_001836346.2 chaperone regulator [Coprinopsis cinerea okayama7\